MPGGSILRKGQGCISTTPPEPFALTQAVFAIPGDLATPTGGYGYDRRVLELLPSYGIAAKAVALPGSFPSPTGDDLVLTEKLLTAVPQEAALLVDGLAFGALPPPLLGRLKSRRVVALVHHPLALESGIDESRRRALHESEATALARADHVVVTSPATERTLVADFGVPAAKITVAEPGTDPAHRATGTGTPLQLLAVGAVSPRKAYDVLVSALEPLGEFDWRLTIAGALDRNAAATAALKRQIEASPLSERIHLAGVVVPATLERYYDSADLFVMPSLFEGYGMVLAEAMARGLPIVCTTGGAAAETVPDGAALKVAPGDAAALTEALRTGLTNKKLRRRMADASWDAGRRLPTWAETARRIAAAVMGIGV